jgi:electron transfer flavoprotein alpha/beta subunit
VLLVTCLKAVWRTDTALRLQSSGRAVNPDGREPMLNPADRSALGLALEVARRLPAQSSPVQVQALAVGPPAWEGLLRDALAWGATAALRVWHADWPADRPLDLDGSAETTRLHAHAAAAALRPLAPALVLVGQRSGDAGHECFGAFLAQALGAAYAHRVTEVEPIAGGWRVVAELERGYAQRMELAAPAVLSIPPHLPGPPDAGLPAWLRSRTAAIAHASAELAAPPRAATTARAPIPRVKRHTVLPATLSAEERIRALVTLPSGSGGTVVGAEHSADQQADAILTLLKSRGYR